MLGAEAALWALAVLCPLARGGAPAWVLWPLAALSSAALVLACVGARRQRMGVRVHPVAWGLALVAAACLVQLVPLPQGLLRLLSPSAAELHDFALAPLGLGGARPVSLDTPSTWRELAKHLSYLAAFVAAAQVARSRRARKRLLGALALSGALVAVIGYGHQLVGAQRLFGVLAFQHATPPLLTPFGNPNHLAGFLIVSSTLALGLFLSARGQERAWVWGAAFLACGVAVLLSLSRAGIFFFGVALALLGALVLVGQRAGSQGRGVARLVWVLLGAVGTAGIGGYLALDRLLAEASTADSLEKLRASKIDLWPAIASAARQYWIAGMGRGAFQLGFSRFQQVLPGNTFSHPENLLLQLWAELGLPAALAVIALALWGFAKLLRRASGSVVDVAAVAAVAALVLHNLFDFNLELPACAVALWIALGCLSRPGESADEPVPEISWWRDGVRLPARPAILAAAGLAAVSGLCLLAGRSTLEAAEAELNAAAAHGSPEEVRKLALRLIDRHPADHLLYDIVGRAYARSGADPRQALAFVNRALFLRPIDAEAHLTAARSLLRLGKRSQAFLEYRLAAEGVDTQAVLNEAVLLARSVEELEALVPRTPILVCEVAERLAAAGRGDDAVALLSWATEAVAEHPEVARVWRRLAAAQIARGDPAAALASIDEAERRAPGDPEPVILQSNALWAMGKREEAAALLDARVVKQPGHIELSFTLAERLLEASQPVRALSALSRASPFVPPASRGRWLVLQAKAYEQLDKPFKALEAYQSAARLQPESPELHYAVARLLERARRHTDAIDAVRLGMRHDSPAGVERAKAWVQRLVEAERALDAARRAHASPGSNASELDGLIGDETPP